MKKIFIFLFSIAALAGCRDKQKIDPMPETKAIQRIPVFAAEIYEESSRSSGRSSVSMTLLSSYESETNISKYKSASTETEQWESVATVMNFDLKKGLMCKLIPTFVEHKDDNDIWKLDLQYKQLKQHEGAEFWVETEQTETLSFDGVNPVIIAEDEGYKILIRPQSSSRRI